jgi:dTDP-4-dehydrorhamnose reductase
LSDARRVLLVGASGQVGRACALTVPPGVELRAPSRAELDLADAARIQASIDDFAPHVVINAAAYTAVDKAESEREAARLGNTEGPGHLARALAGHADARLIHLSTDFVFDGSASVPYGVDAEPRPLGVYGATKLGGELLVRAALGDRATIVRTAWVYSSTGRNFVRTMLGLMSSGPVRVVADQVGTPTAARPLADVLWRLATGGGGAGGILHWTDAGVASWYDFAVAIAEEGVAAGLLAGPVDVTPIASRDFPTAARRPSYSVLDKSATIAAVGATPLHWRARLREVMGELRSA